MRETFGQFNPQMEEGQANPQNEEELKVLKYEVGENGLEEVVDDNKIERPLGFGSEVLTYEERQELEDHSRQLEKNRKKWEQNKDETLLGKFINKVVGSRFMRVLIPAILIHGYSLSASEKHEISPSEKVEIVETQSNSYFEENPTEVDVDLELGVKEYKVNTVQEGETRPVVREIESSRMVSTEPATVEMKWARSYDVKEMDKTEVASLTEKIDKIIDDYLSKNNISIDDLKKLKERGVENELFISGLSSPEGDEMKNEQVKEARARLAQELVKQRLSEKGLSEYFQVSDNTRDGGGAFLDGQWQGSDEVFKKLSEAFSVKSEKDLLDIVKKYNRGQLSEDDMTLEQAKLMNEVFDQNRGVKISLKGGAIDRNVEIDLQKDQDKVNETLLKIPTVEKADFRIKKSKSNKTRGNVVRKRSVQTGIGHKKVVDLKKAEDGVFEQFSGIEDPQIYEQLPLGRRNNNNLKKQESLVGVKSEDLRGINGSHSANLRKKPAEIYRGEPVSNKISSKYTDRNFGGATNLMVNKIVLGRTEKHRGDRGIRNFNRVGKEPRGGRRTG